MGAAGSGPDKGFIRHLAAGGAEALLHVAVRCPLVFPAQRPAAAASAFCPVPRKYPIISSFTGLS